MKFKLEFRTDTVAFEGDPTEEINRILWQMIERVQNGGIKGTIRDMNGTVIGEYETGDK